MVIEDWDRLEEAEEFEGLAPTAGDDQLYYERPHVSGCHGSLVLWKNKRQVEDTSCVEGRGMTLVLHVNQSLSSHLSGLFTHRMVTWSL